jgi:hypothetical protein
MSRLAFHRPARFPPPPDEKAVLPAPPGAQSRAAATTWMSMLLPLLTSAGMAGSVSAVVLRPGRCARGPGTDVIAQLGLSAGTVPLALTTFVVSPPGAGLRAGTGLGSRAPGAKAAGAPRKLSTGMLWPGILASSGVGGLAGLAARDGSLVTLPGRGGAPRSQPRRLLTAWLVRGLPSGDR